MVQGEEAGHALHQIEERRRKSQIKAWRREMWGLARRQARVMLLSEKARMGRKARPGNLTTPHEHTSGDAVSMLARHGEQYDTFSEIVIISHPLRYLYTWYTTSSAHAFGAPLVRQRLNSSPLELDANLVFQASALHDTRHSLVPLCPKQGRSDGAQFVLVDEAP